MFLSLSFSLSLSLCAFTYEAVYEWECVYACVRVCEHKGVFVRACLFFSPERVCMNKWVYAVFALVQVDKIYNHKGFMEAALSLSVSRSFLRSEREKAKAFVREELEELSRRYLRLCWWEVCVMLECKGKTAISCDLCHLSLSLPPPSPLHCTRRGPFFQVSCRGTSLLTHSSSFGG